MLYETRQNAPAAKVLIVDDDVLFQTVLSDMLSDQGYAVEHAVTAAEAIDRIGKNKPDIVLIDSRAGGSNGYDLCRRLNRDQTFCSLPVVMMLDADEQHAVDQAFDAGARDFVIKPVDYATLLQRLRFTLRACSAHRRLYNCLNIFKAAHHTAGLGYWLFEHAIDRFEVSEQLATMCSLNPDRHYSLADYIACIAEQDRNRFSQAIDTVLHQHQAVTIEYHLRLRDGSGVLVKQDIGSLGQAPDNIMLGTVQDISRQKAAEDRIRKMAYYDALTGLASRSYFMQHLGEAISHARRHQQKLSLLFLDLDRFKDINDSLGHNVGDFLLKEIARRLRHSLRDSDFIARLGGDEFCVLIAEYNHLGEVAKVAEHCLAAINHRIELDSREYNPKVSIGIANYPDDADNLHDLLKAADSAMYAAKQNGKHRYAFYDPTMTAKAEQRMRLEAELKQAFSRQEFELYYQPQISFVTGRMVGVEALTRWNHPHRGLVSPDQFIPVLEQMGLITELGEWVIEQACRQVKQWKQLGAGELSVSVNISPQHFSTGSLADIVGKALSRYRIDPQLFEIEITESMVQTGKEIRTTFAALKQLGISIAIDDFGTGYSSLGSLKNLPIDCLKIDRLFVRDLAQHTDDNIMLGTIFGMAHALDYKVVAEGVETEDQALILAGMGCDLAQGYLYSKPVPADKIPALFNACFLPEGKNAKQASG